MVFGIAHAVEQVVFPHGFITLAEKRNILIAKYKAHMRNTSDKVFRAIDDTVSDQVRPKLLRKFKSLGYLDGFAYIYRTVRALWRIVQFAECGMAGSGIVPCTGTFCRHRIQTLEYCNACSRGQLLDHPSQGCVPHSRHDKNNLHLLS